MTSPSHGVEISGTTARGLNRKRPSMRTDKHSFLSRFTALLVVIITGTCMFNAGAPVQTRRAIRALLKPERDKTTRCTCWFEKFPGMRMILSADPPHMPSCYCSNVCIDFQANRVVMFGNASTAGLQQDWALNVAGRFLPEMERLHGTEEHALHGDGIIRPVFVAEGSEPRSWSWDDRTIFIARRFSAYNPAHVMIETGIPLVRLMLEVAGCPDENTSHVCNADKLRANAALFLNDSCIDQEDRWASMGPSELCETFTSTYLSSLFDTTFRRHPPVETGICFAYAAFGHLRYNVYTAGRPKDLHAEYLARRSYRHMVYTSNGLRVPAPVRPGITPLTITLVKKYGRRTFSNFDEIEEHMARRWSSVCGMAVKINSVELQKITMDEQLRMLATTTLLITPPGANSWASLFLPEGAVMIIGSYCVLEPTPSCNSWDVDAFHNDTPGLDTLIYAPTNISADVVPRSVGNFDVKVRTDILDSLVQQAVGTWLVECNKA